MPQSVVLVLLYVGVVRLLALHWSTVRLYAEDLAPVGWSSYPPARLVVILNLAFVLYLWLDYRSRSASGKTRVALVACVGASLLLAYLTWVFWQLTSEPAPGLERML